MIMLSQQQRIFFELLRFCIGTVQEVPSSLKGADWRVLSGSRGRASGHVG